MPQEEGDDMSGPLSRVSTIDFAAQGLAEFFDALQVLAQTFR